MEKSRQRLTMEHRSRKRNSYPARTINEHTYYDISNKNGNKKMKTPPPELKLEMILNRSANNKYIFGTVVNIESGDDTFFWSASAGNVKAENPYFIASTTKLYITALVLNLRADGRLRLEDKISQYISKEIISGIHVHSGIDHSYDITIGQLMSHTSGLPDYFQQKRECGLSLQAELTAGHDQSWTSEKVIHDVKKMKPKFKPGTKGKALYSDTNYQLLGRIIEIIIGKKIGTVLKEFIFESLQLKNTYLYEDSNDTTPVSLYYKTHPLHIPLAMTSFGPDGGIVSTAKETMIFLRAFFNGQFFPREYLRELFIWNKIFFPLEYGLGVARFKLPRIFSPFKPIPELIGHSGLSGAFAYYCPEKDLYLTGTVNQIAKPGLSYRLMIKLLNCFE